MHKNLDLFLTFMKIGAFTFGGGYAMIPLIQREVCDNKKWMKEQDILEIVAIAESTPGPIAINAATFVGFRFMPCFIGIGKPKSDIAPVKQKQIDIKQRIHWDRF